MDTTIDDFRKAGKIAARIREESRSLVMIGESLLDVAENIEKMIRDEGASPAFPVNISLNSIAAHYTPEFGSTQNLTENDIVKVDLGVELNGGLADTAYTIDLSGKYEQLVKASEEALANAINAIKPGVTTSYVGGIVEETIKKYGFKPISNLTGHKIEPYDLHAGVSLPSVGGSGESYSFQEGDIFAVEPFATNGAGYVEDMEQVEIFSVYAPNPVRMRQSRQILQHVLDNYGVLPFAERWVRSKFSSKMLVSMSLKELLASHTIRGYPVLRDTGNGMVAQTEHTIVVTENGCEVMTK